MEKKFRVLRIIGTLWKVLAWITLIGGILFSLGILLVGVLGSGDTMLRLWRQEMDMIPTAVGIVSGVVGFIVSLVATIIYFLLLYAVGDLIYLLLAIEENTRRTTQQLWQRSAPAGIQGPPPPPPPPPSPQTEPPDTA